MTDRQRIQCTGFGITIFLFSVSLGATQGLLPLNGTVANDLTPARARAFAAPSGANAVDEIAVDGEKKSFIKIGGVRDGVQKAIFDEAGEVAPDVDNNENRGRDFSFGFYDDNSVVDSRHEQPLWIPPLYRNETEEEKAATATTTKPPPTTTTAKAQTVAPIFTRRPLVAQEISNRPPIPVRTTPPTIAATFAPFTVVGRQPFTLSAPFRPPQFQLQQQQQFVPQQTQKQQFVPQQPQQSQQQLLVPQQPQQFIPRQPLQQQFVPQQQQTVFRPQTTQQRQFVPQQQLTQQFIPQQRPVQTQQQQFQSVSQQQPFLPQQQQQRPFQPPQQQQQQFVPKQQQPQPQPQPRPFQPAQNNFANQQTRPQHGGDLRTGVCANTIFYESAPAAPFDLHLTYSHFATVVSIDQCARTCHEFNCANALFDPSTRRCQFNPTTVFSVPQGTCPLWPNPLYRNNVPATSQPLRIFCVICQRRRRAGHRPVTFRTTGVNRFDQRSFSRNVANVALHGVTLERPSATLDDKLLGFSDKLEALGASPKDADLEIAGGPSAPDAVRTTIKPQPIKFQAADSGESSVESVSHHRGESATGLRIPSGRPELKILALRTRTTINNATAAARRHRRAAVAARPSLASTVVASGALSVRDAPTKRMDTVSISG